MRRERERESESDVLAITLFSFLFMIITVCSYHPWDLVHYICWPHAFLHASPGSSFHEREKEREKVKSDLVGIRLDFYRWRARGRRGPVVPAARVAASGVPRFLGVVFLAGSLRRFSRLFLRVSGKNQNKKHTNLFLGGRIKKITVVLMCIIILNFLTIN